MHTQISTRACLAVLVAACVFTASAYSSEADTAHSVLMPNEIEWQSGPDFIEPGAELVVLAGNPGEGAFTARLKLPAGYDIHAHEHTADKYLTVVSGAMHIGFGEELDKSQGTKVGPGAFVKVPAGHHHYEWFEEETVLQVHMHDAIQVIYADPANDPRKR